MTGVGSTYPLCAANAVSLCRDCVELVLGSRLSKDQSGSYVDILLWFTLSDDRRPYRQRSQARLLFAPRPLLPPLLLDLRVLNGRLQMQTG